MRSRIYAGLVVDESGDADERPPLVLLHGLTFDRTMWRPALTELEVLEPGRQVLAIDLPGHGESPDATSYSMDIIVERVHAAVLEADLDRPVVVGHSVSAVTASMYAAQHLTRGVVTVEGSLRAAGFARMLQSLEPVLRGPGFAEAWSRIAANVFRLDEVSPDVRDFVVATSRPRQEIELGYWQDLFERAPNDLDAWIDRGAAAIRSAGISYVAVLGAEPGGEALAWMTANLPAARSEVWPRSGHFPHLAHPRRFAQLLATTHDWDSSPRPGPSEALSVG